MCLGNFGTSFRSWSRCVMFCICDDICTPVLGIVYWRPNIISFWDSLYNIWCSFYSFILSAHGDFIFVFLLCRYDKARSIWYSGGGGGAWTFRPGRKNFSDKMGARLFFSPARRAGLLFFHCRKQFLNMCSIKAFATTLYIIQASATTSCWIHAFTTKTG